MSGIALRDQELTIATLEAMIGSPMFPDRYEDVADALATLFVGREMGLPPMTALNHLYVVNGQVGMEGKTMLALIYRAGHKVHVSLSNTEAIVTAYRWDEAAFPHDDRPGGYYEAGEFTFTMQDAITAGLWEKDNYQNYPATMLGWKAVAMAARFAYPDIIIGGYNPEDLGYEGEIEDFPKADYIEGGEVTEDEATEALIELVDAEIDARFDAAEEDG